MSTAGGDALGVAGGVVLLVCLADLFVTVFNYDGFTLLASRLHRALWAVLRTVTTPLPGTARAATLSLGSAAMLPLTLLWWLALQVSGFAMMYLPGLAAHDFTTSHGALLGPQGAFYLSGGDLTSLTFGDVVARAPEFRMLLDLETVIGLATFTIGLTYVLAAFDAFGTLSTLHGRVRRQAIEPNRPETILARHFRDGQAQELSTLLAALVDDLASYDDALRRYPVVFYFHTRREERSIPRIYAALGDLIELLRWGLPAREPVTCGPYLLALQDQYTITSDRLQRSFVGSGPPTPPQPVDAATFAAGSAASVREFRRLRERAARSTGTRVDSGGEDAYRQYREWLGFHAQRRELVRRLADALCYRRVDAETAS